MPEIPIVKEIKLDGFTLDVRHFLTTSYEDIQAATDELPSVIEWINEQHQQLYEQKLVKKAEIAEAEATAYFALTGVSEDNFEGNYPGSKRTEASIGHAVAIDPGVKEAKRDYAVLSGWVSRLSGLIGSLQARLDLLRSSEATRRQVFSEQDPDKGRGGEND